MVENFEQYTEPLNAAELVMLDLFMAGIERRTVTTAIKSDEIIRLINAKLPKHGITVKLTGERLRKISNYIRVNSLLPLCATSRGYYVATERTEIESQIQSLRDRAKAIEAAATGLESFLKPIKTSPVQTQATLFDVADNTTEL